MELSLEQKRNRLFVILSGIFITNALLAEIIGVKIFSAESTVGLEPAQLDILGFVMDFNLTAGALIWPVVFITTDLINEYFGKPGVKRISYLTALLIGQLVDVFIFQRLRRATGNRWLWVRATGSTLVSQLVDSFVVLFIAFYGVYSNDNIVAI